MSNDYVQGGQADDINSLVEWVRVAIGVDKTADDEDDDDENNIILVKTCGFALSPQYFQLILKPQFVIIEKKVKFSPFNEKTSLTAYIEVNTPPPDFC